MVDLRWLIFVKSAKKVVKMTKICCEPPNKTLLLILVNILWSTKDISMVLIKVIEKCCHKSG